LFILCLSLASCGTVFKVYNGGRERLDLSDRLKVFSPEKKWSNQKDIQVFWTKESIPYIKAQTDEDLFYASGVVQAHLRGAQLEMFRLLSRGRFSEAVGSRALPMDTFLRTVDIGRVSDEIIARWSDETRLFAKAFVRGLNDYNKNQDKLPLDIQLMGFDEIKPWTLEDLVYVHRLMGLDINWQVWMEFIKVYREKKYQDFNFFWKTWVEKFFNSSLIPKRFSFNSLGIINNVTEAGSNAFALSGDKTYSGKAIVAGDPHLGINLPSYWLFMGLESPSFKVFGVGIPSFPLPAMGRTRDIAWTGTNMWGVSSFLYKLSDQELKTSVQRKEVFKPRFTSKTVEITVTDTDYGPIVSDTTFLKSNDPLALKWAGHRPSLELEALLNVTRSKDVFEFKKALKDFSVVAINYVVADKKGNISKVHAAHLPVLTDHKKAFVQDPGNKIIKYQTVMDLPERLNPKRGYVVSANEYNEEAEYSLCWFCSTSDRADRISKLLADGKVDLNRVKKIHVDIYSEEAKKITEFFQSEWKRFEFKENRNFRLLKEWDFEYSVEAKQPYLYEELIRRFAEQIYTKAGLDKKDVEPLFQNLIWKKAVVQWYKNLHPSDQKYVLTKTKKAFDRLRPKKWGKVHQIEAAHPLSNVPVLGDSYRYYRAGYPGSSNTVFKAAHGYNGDYKVTFGANLRVIFDMRDEDENYAVLLGGQDGYLGSKTFADQIPTWIDGSYYKVPFRTKTIAEQSAQTIVLEAK
jgi:penicillin amidase